MLCTFAGRLSYMQHTRHRRTKYPRNCGTDEESQSGVGATILPPAIDVPKSKIRVYNQAECEAVNAARKVCVYVRCRDPSKFPAC